MPGVVGRVAVGVRYVWYGDTDVSVAIEEAPVGPSVKKRETPPSTDEEAPWPDVEREFPPYG